MFRVVDLDAGTEWACRIPVEVKDWDPDRAVQWIFNYLRDLDQTNPPLHGTWTEEGEKALAKVLE